MDFTSRQFRAFLLVAQHRSFSRAAEALYITPSGLSVLIRELETQLGFRLFPHAGFWTARLVSKQTNHRLRSRRLDFPLHSINANRDAVDKSENDLGVHASTGSTLLGRCF